MENKKPIQKAIDSSLTYEEYHALVNNLVQEEKTTGPKQTEDLIYYTKLNAQRGNRLDKTITLDESTANMLKELPDSQIWLVLTESWCGDAAQILPLLNKVALENSNIQLKLALRDENLELMDQFLTNGGRSIPKLIVMDDQLNVLGSWGPRPQEAQELYNSWKKDPDRVPYKEFAIDMQKWYLKDKGQSTFRELRELLSAISHQGLTTPSESQT